MAYVGIADGDTMKQRSEKTFSLFSSSIESTVTEAQEHVMAHERAILAKQKEERQKQQQQQQQVLTPEGSPPVSQSSPDEVSTAPRRPSKDVRPAPASDRASVSSRASKRSRNVPSVTIEAAATPNAAPAPTRVIIPTPAVSAIARPVQRQPYDADYFALPIEVRNSIVKDHFAKYLLELSTPRKCTMCKTFYVEARAMGRHECRWHPGTLIEMIDPRTNIRVAGWSCCNTRMHSNRIKDGCCPCDHSHEVYKKTNTNELHIPIALVHYLGIDERMVRYITVPLSNTLRVVDALRLTYTLERASYTRVSTKQDELFHQNDASTEYNHHLLDVYRREKTAPRRLADFDVVKSVIRL